MLLCKTFNNFEKTPSLKNGWPAIGQVHMLCLHLHNPLFNRNIMEMIVVLGSPYIYHEIQSKLEYLL